MRQPCFSFLPHSDMQFTRMRCFCLQENESPSSITWCAGEDSAFRDLIVSRYLHTPGPVHYLLVSGSEFHFEVASLVIQIADKKRESNSGICTSSSCGNYHPDLLGVRMVGAFLRKRFVFCLEATHLFCLSYMF